MAEQFHHQQQLKNPKYTNWVKACLGLKYLKDGLQIFSDEKVKQQHDDIVNAVKQKHNLTTVNCGQCILQKLQPDHVRINKQCPLGCKDCKCQYPGGNIACPNNVCGAIYDQIILNHASNPPAPFWKNTCVQKWCTDEWEVAKCFINAPGYASKSNSSEIDCTGLLHLFINSKFLQTKIVCKITGQDVFSKTRSARNAIFHSTSMEMDDIECIQYIDNMIAVLEDGKELLNRPESIAAVAMLNELKNSRFEAEILREAKAYLKETVEAVKSAGEDFNLKAKQNLDLIEKTRNDVINDIELNTEKARDQIKADADAKTEDCKTSIRLAQFEACEKVDNCKKAAETAVAEQVTDAKKEIVEVFQHGKLTYMKSKEDFRRSLIEMYVENVVNISPILLQPDRCDVRIDQLYIDPLINILPKNENEDSERIQSYKQIFRKDDKQQKSIYLIGEAGSGKSTFCINMINNWCIAHSDNQAEDTMNIQEMKRYQFLFYLPLRQEDTYDHVEEMILSHYENPIIKTIFEQEPEDCLILLDGLDEWKLKTEPKTSLFQSRGLPRCNLSKGYTIITTSRPWKFESIGLKNTEIQIKLQLKGVYDSQALIEKTVSALNEMFDDKKKTSDFQNYLANSRIDDEIKLLPIILQLLICLWFDDKISCIGKSDIYCKMLWMFFEWTELRTGNEDVLRCFKDKSLNIDIPDQLNYRELCPELKFVIKNIAHLAFATLTTTRKESSLIFEDSTFKNLNIDIEVITYCLKCGIISKQRAVGLSLNRRQHLSFSFVHKSMQEFLCALHIFTEFKRSAPHLFKPCHLSTIDKNLICFETLFENCKTANDILELSNVFTFLCGFDTYLAAHISKFVYNIVGKDKDIINYRTNLSYRPFKPVIRPSFFTYDCFEGHQTYPLDIQNLLFSFIKEANIHDEKPERLFFLSDFVFLPLFMIDLEPINYVNPALIISMNIDFLDTPFRQVRQVLLEFLKHPFLGLTVSTLKLWMTDYVIKDPQITLTLCNLIQRSTCLLKCLSFKGQENYPPWLQNPMHIIKKQLISVLPIMYKLEIINLENIELTFREITDLSKWLSNATYLRQISLRNISQICYSVDTSYYTDSPTTYIDLTKHNELQVLDHDFDTIKIIKFNVQNLETCSFYLRSNTISESVAKVLNQSKKLKCLCLTGQLVRLETGTKIIQNLLPNLASLTQLHLEVFSFSENIIVDPIKMLNIREITLEEIDMPADSWDRLLESVFRLPQNVKIHIQNMFFDFLFWKNILHNRGCQLLNLKPGSNYVTFSTKPEDP